MQNIMKSNTVEKFSRKTINIGAAFTLNDRKRAIDVINFFMQTKINLLFLWKLNFIYYIKLFLCVNIRIFSSFHSDTYDVNM